MSNGSTTIIGRVPDDIIERGQTYDRARGGDGPRIKILSSEKLERQIAAEGASWLDRELTAREPLVIADSGFGQDVRMLSFAAPTASFKWAMQPSGGRGPDSCPYRHESRAARGGSCRSQMAPNEGLHFTSSKAGEYVSGRLTGVASLASGRFAMIEDGLGFPAWCLGSPFSKTASANLWRHPA